MVDRSMAGLSDEVVNGNFADERLNERLARMVRALAAQPSLSLPRVFDSAGLEGAYRFLSNHRVNPTSVLSAHFEATRKRCEQAETVLIAHDSTSFSFRWDGEREGLGRAQPRNDASTQSFYAHFSLVITADGTRRPLGVAGFKTWIREKTRTETEYQRWEDQIRSSSAQVNGLKNAIHLADREADDYEMFCALSRDGHRFVVRCTHNRLLQSSGDKLKLFDALAGAAPTVEREVPISRRKPSRVPAENKVHPPRGKRIARLMVSASRVELKRPLSPRKHPRMQTPESLWINVVHVWEPEPPEGEEPVEWYLHTTEPIETAQQQLAIVDYYRTRWVIEEYIKALKTGCSFEKRQIEDYEGLVNLLAIFAPIACRLLLIRGEAARDPELPALHVVSQDELDVLRVLGRLKLTVAPTVREIYFAVAALGGHIKWNGNPGWQTLAHGFETLQTMTAGWRAAKLQPASDQS